MLPAPAPWTERLVPSLDLQYVYFRSQVTGNDVFRDTGIDGLFDARERGPTGAPQGSGPDLNQDDVPLAGGTEGDGIYQEGELLANRGQRATLFAAAGRPVPAGKLRRALSGSRLVPGALRQRRAPASSSAGMRPRASSCARACAGASAIPLTHLLEPRIGYALVTARGADPGTRSSCRARPSSSNACASSISTT